MTNKLTVKSNGVEECRGSIRKWSGVFLVTVVLIAGLSGSVLAELATKIESESVARNWVSEMTAKRGQWAGATDPLVVTDHELRQDGRLLAHYYDVAPRGFVVVPILKEMNPVVMYSDESILDESQDGGMLQLLRDIISSRLEMYEGVYGSLAASQPTGGATLFDVSQSASWERLAVDQRAFRADQSLAATDEVGPLLTSSWHQREPYNNSCPMGDGGLSVVGCTATSLSQILDYWEWPANGVGSHSYYWGGDDCNGGYVAGQTLVADFSDAYDWANIPDSCDGTTPCTQAQEDALAELCYEAGVSVSMGYSNCGSGANMNMEVFPTHFKYSSEIAREYRVDHTVESWFAVMQAEVDAGRVMWYHINSHAIVCDGWRDQGAGQLECHFNYGWGQGNNAWYVLDNLYCGWIDGDICPYEQEDVTIQIQPQYDPAIEFVGRTVTEIIGDGDGLVEAGETAQIDVTIMNLGNYATNTAGSLTSADANADVTSGATTFGPAFGWGEQSGSQSSFVVEIDPACPDPHVVTLDLEVTADGGYVTTVSFLMFVGHTAGWADDLESDVSLWRHDNVRMSYADEWHIEAYRAHSGSSSWKAGGDGAGNHSDAADGALVTPPFLLPGDATMTFWHWMEAEDDAGMTAWDGSIVMIGTGDGNWTQIDPAGGYPYTIIDNDASPFAPGTPCYSGSFDWSEAMFDLSAHSGVVQIMFRFGSDGAANFEGWYVDDVVVDGITSCCVGRVGNANGEGGDAPTIGDISVMIDAKFITGTCDGILECLPEADVNQSGGVDPTCDDITIADISKIIDRLFITGPSLVLPDCF